MIWLVSIQPKDESEYRRYVTCISFQRFMPAKYGSTSLAILDPFFSCSSDLITSRQKDSIYRIIPAVSWWTEWHESCLELHAVQDADRLDAIGAVGIFRVAAYSGAKGRTLVGLEGDTAEAHFHDKLLKVKDRMKVGSTPISQS
jgi:uncharacterized protein